MMNEFLIAGCSYYNQFKVFRNFKLGSIEIMDLFRKTWR